MLRFGPNGIPLSCKGRTWLDALYDVKELELEAIEFQLLRGIGDPIHECELIKETGEELDIFIAVHAPYYMDLLGDDESAARSIEYLKWSGVVADSVGAKLVVTHVGFYGDLTKKEAIDRAVVMIRKVRDHYKKKKYTHRLGVEVHGKQDLFGNLEEILEVTKRVSGTVPVVNFAHLHARERGFFKKKEDFEEVFEELFAADTPFVYTLFSGLEHDFEGNELRFTPIKKGDMRFNPLAEILLDHEDKEIIVISSSPLLEHDAQYMKVILSRTEEKRVQKAIAQKAAEEAAKIEAAKKKKEEAARKKKEAEKKKKEAEKKKKKAEAEKKKKADAEKKKKAEAEKKKKADAEKKKKAEAEKKKKAEAEKKKKEEAEKKKKADAEKKKKAEAEKKKKAEAEKKKDDTKKTSAKKADTKGSGPKKPAANKSPAKKTDKKKSEGKKTETKKSAPKKTDAKKSETKKPGTKASSTRSAGKGSDTKKSASKKTDPKRSAAKKSTAKKTDTKKSDTKGSGTKGSASKKSDTKSSSKKSGHTSKKG